MSGESPFRHLYTSVIREFKHRWCRDVLNRDELNQEVSHSLVRSYLSLNVNNVLVFDFLYAFSITEHPNKRTITEVKFNKIIYQQGTFM